MPDSSNNHRWTASPYTGWLSSFVPSLLLTGTIFFLGLSADGPDVALPVAWADKVKHALAFWVLGYSYLRTAKTVLPRWEVSRRRRLAAMVAVSVGAVLELLQALLPYRTAEWGDLLADILGVGAALLSVRLVDGDSR